VDPPEDAVRVLRHAHRLCRPGGIVLDLTSVPPAATMELDGAELGELDQVAFLADAAITEQAVEQFLGDGLLEEEASRALDVLAHFDSGRDAIADMARRGRTRLPDALRARLEHIDRPVVERSHCLLRRLRVAAR
jgi:hypothetical protein